MPHGLILALGLALTVHEAPSGFRYPMACCGDQDCRPVPCDEIVEVEHGYVWSGITFTRDRVRMSEDMTCHVCVHGERHMPICVFILPVT